MTDTTTVGRLQLDHPDLGHEGGTDLHNHVRSAWTKIADNMDSRFFTHDALANSAFIDFNHNFKTAFDELRINLYSRNTGTGELTRIKSGGSPDLDDFTIAATTGSETVSVRVTNNTGGPQDIAAVIVHGKGAEKLNDLDDVDTVTTPPALGQTLVYDGSSFVPGAASGGGEVNAIDNWNAEADTTGWATYKDGAATEPNDGIGPGASIVLSVQSAVALRGAQSFKIAKDAVNRIGEGISYDFAIAEQDQSRKLKIQFDFKTDEDAGYASGDMRVFIYDVDNSQLITPVDTDIVRGVNIFQTSFNSTTSTNYRLIFHIANTSALAYDVYLDNVIVGPGMTSQGAVVGSWESFNPSYIGLSSGSTKYAYKRRVGDSMQIKIRIENGSGTGAFGLNIPDGLSTTDPEMTSGALSDVNENTFWGAYSHSLTQIRFFAGSTPKQNLSSDTLMIDLHFPVAEFANQGIVPMLAEDNLSEWVDFTPTFDNDSGTPTVDFAQKRRLGSNLEMKIRISNANSNGSDYRLNLPDNLTPIADNPISGVLFRSQVTNVFEAKVATDDIEFLSGGSVLGTDYTFTSETLEMDIKVPVVEYQGSQNSLVGYSLASESQTGLVSTSTQTIAGDKTFSGKLIETDICAFMAYKNTDTSITSNSWINIGTDITSFDEGGDESNGVFTAPTDGIYTFQASIGFTYASVPSSFIGAGFNITGLGYMKFEHHGTNYPFETGVLHQFNGCITVKLNQGNTVTLQMISITDWTLKGVASGEKITYWSGHRVHIL